MTLLMTEIFWFRDVGFSKLQKERPKKGIKQNIMDFLKRSACPALLPPLVHKCDLRLLGFCPDHNRISFFPPQKYPYREKKQIQQQHTQSRVNLHQFGFGTFFPSVSSNTLAGFPFILCQFNFHLHFKEISFSFPATYYFRLSKPTVRHLYMPSMSAANTKMKT